VNRSELSQSARFRRAVRRLNGTY